MMEINKLLTPYNYNDGDTSRIKYIVIHYVGATGGAYANCKYYASAYLGASAHYFVGFDGEIWQSVEDANIAWHCGASSYKHAECRNSNSIGIEMCVRNSGSQADTSKDWYFEDTTVKAATALTKELMGKYGIDADHVIRHYDVTGKICPNPYVYNTTKHTWADFLAAVAAVEEKSGWVEENSGWRYYLSNDKYVADSWYESNGEWYWFDGAGMMVSNVWYQYNGEWYYLGEDGAMARGQQTIDGKWYIMGNDGAMVTDPVLLTPDQDGALQWPGLAE